jgi:hypothetical protein
MRTIETTATITPDGMLTAHLPDDIIPGEHPVVIVIDEPDTAHDVAHRPLVELHPVPWTNWPDGATFRREELYGDDGR